MQVLTSNTVLIRKTVASLMNHRQLYRRIQRVMYEVNCKNAEEELCKMASQGKRRYFFHGLIAKDVREGRDEGPPPELPPQLRRFGERASRSLRFSCSNS